MGSRLGVFNAPMADEKRTELNRRHAPTRAAGEMGCRGGSKTRPRCPQFSAVLRCAQNEAGSQERSDGNKTNRVYTPSMIPKNGTGRAMKAARIAIARADRLRANKSAAATSATMPDNIFQTMMQTYRRWKSAIKANGLGTRDSSAPNINVAVPLKKVKTSAI